MEKMLGTTELQAESKRRKIAEETINSQSIKSILTKLLASHQAAPSAENRSRSGSVDKSLKVLKHFATVKLPEHNRNESIDKSKKDHKDLLLTGSLWGKEVLDGEDTHQELKITLEDRIKMPSANPEINFYMSIVRPNTPAKVNVERKIMFKETNHGSALSPTPKRNSFVIDSQKKDHSRRYTVLPMKRNSITKPHEANSTHVKEHTLTIKDSTELINTFPLGRSEENKKYIQRIQQLQKSKKRCAAESDLLKTYQKLISFIP